MGPPRVSAKLVVAELRLEGGAVGRMARNRLCGSVLIGRDAGRPPVRGQIGVQFVITEEFVHRAVKAVGARFGRDTDDAAFIVPKLCRGILGDDVEFLDGVNIRNVGSFVVLVFAVQNAVEEVLVRLFAVAVDKRTAAIVQVLRLVNPTRIIGRGTRSKEAQLKIVASRQRHRSDGRGIDQCADLRGFRLQHRSCAGDLNGFRCLANLQLRVDARRLVQNQR